MIIYHMEYLEPNFETQRKLYAFNMFVGFNFNFNFLQENILVSVTGKPTQGATGLTF